MFLLGLLRAFTSRAQTPILPIGVAFARSLLLGLAVLLATLLPLACCRVRLRERRGGCGRAKAPEAHDSSLFGGGVGGVEAIPLVSVTTEIIVSKLRKVKSR